MKGFFLEEGKGWGMRDEWDGIRDANLWFYLFCLRDSSVFSADGECERRSVGKWRLLHSERENSDIFSHRHGERMEFTTRKGLTS